LRGVLVRMNSNVRPQPAHVLVMRVPLGVNRVTIVGSADGSRSTTLG